MKQNKNTIELENLKTTIVESILEKKGNNVVTLNLMELENASFDYFIITDAESDTQVEAIAEFVEQQVLEKLSIKALHKEGVQNAQWILLDFGGVLVHVFQRIYREFYDLENLWADAEREYFQDK